MFVFEDLTQARVTLEKRRLVKQMNVSHFVIDISANFSPLQSAHHCLLTATCFASHLQMDTVMITL